MYGKRNKTMSTLNNLDTIVASHSSPQQIVQKKGRGQSPRSLSPLFSIDSNSSSCSNSSRCSRKKKKSNKRSPSPSPTRSSSSSPSRSSSPSPSRGRTKKRSKSKSKSRSRSNSSNRSTSLDRAIKNPYLRQISDNELRYDYPPHSLSFKLKKGKFKTNQVPNKVCRLLTSHCTKRHPLLRDQKPRHTQIQLSEL